MCVCVCVYVCVCVCVCVCVRERERERERESTEDEMRGKMESKGGRGNKRERRVLPVLNSFQHELFHVS